MGAWGFGFGASGFQRLSALEELLGRLLNEMAVRQGSGGATGGGMRRLGRDGGGGVEL